MAHEYIEIPGGDHVRAIANNPDMMRKVFDFFDAHRAPAPASKPGS